MATAITEAKIKLEDPSFLKRLEAAFEQARDHDGVPEARAIAKNLQLLLDVRQDFRQNHPDLYRQYREMILKFKFVAIPLLSEEEVEKLFAELFLYGLQIPGFNFKQAFDGFLLTFPYDRDVPAFSDKIVDTLKKNAEQLGEEPIVTLSGERLRPTVGNWITEYVKANAAKAERGAFEEITFVTKDKNAVKLSAENRETLKKVLDFYDWLEFPTDTEEGEQDPKLAREVQKFVENLPKIVEDVSRRLKEIEKEESAGEKELRAEEEQAAIPIVKPLEAAVPKVPQIPKRVLPPPPLPPPQNGAIANRRIKEFAPASPVPASQAPALKPLQTERLYRETLAELSKIRREEERARQKSAPGPVAAPKERPGARPSVPPAPERPSAPFSVNEALAHAGEQHPLDDHGELISGEKDLDEKLKKLEDKLKP